MSTDIGSAGAPKEQCTWAMACHLSALSGYVIPFGNVIGPLVVWLIKREEMELVDDQGKEALNFQITILIGFAICFVLAFVVVGFFLMIALGIYTLVMIVIAAIKANSGERYRYPATLRLIK